MALTALWIAVIAVTTLFVIVKVRNWGPAIDAPAQDDFASYYYAAQISEKAPLLLYLPGEWRNVLGGDVETLPFLYMPATAIAFQPISHLPYETARRIWFWLSVGCIAATAFLLARRLRSRRAQAIAMAMVVFSPALLDTLFLGQINGVLALFAALACLGLESQKRPFAFLAGFVLGIACCVKPVPIGLAAIALLRRRFAYLAGVGCGVGVFVAVSALALPGGVFQNYTGTIARMSGELAPPGLTIFWNQSILAFGKKLAGGEGAPVTSLLAILAAGVIGLFAGLAILRNSRSASRRTDISISIALLVALLCSPVTWWHYLLIATPVIMTIAEIYVNTDDPLWKMAAPLGLLLVIAQRGTERLVAPAPILAVLSSLMTFGLLFWLLLLAKTSFTHQPFNAPQPRRTAA